MSETVYHLLQQNIQWLSQQKQDENTFVSQKNDQLLQNILRYLIHFAVEKSCSDIHIEPQETHIRIRLRIDGVLHELFHLPVYIFEQLRCKIKILANMNIAQSRLPQDGKCVFEFDDNSKTHIRISTCPTIQGEKIVLRLLKENHVTLNLSELGMTPEQLMLYKKAIHYQHGLILITGPTGSGKTSTLYASLHHINANTRNIITIEDPVEISMPGINQVQIKGELSFASILRSILRQDPDIIMIGEIRDEETANIAIQAANTGHLVFATLHTNNCIETIHRLKHMNIDQNDLISCLKLIVSQRLVRKKKPEYNEYSGRIGIFEMLKFDEKLKIYLYDHNYCREKDLINDHHFTPFAHQIQNYLQSNITSHEEIQRVMNFNEEAL